MSGVISDNTVRSSGAVAPLTSATTDANDPAIDTNPTDGLGTKWINTTSGQIFICIDATTDANEWIGQTTTSIQPRVFCAGGVYSTTGHAGVGKINTVEYINPGTLSDAIDFGDLLAANQYFTGTSNGTNDRGVFGGGCSEANCPTNEIQYFTCSTLGNCIDFGNLSAAVSQAGACSNGTTDRAMWSGGGITGVDNATDVIDYITISTPGNSTDFGNLIIPRNYTAALDNGTNDRGINASGIDDGTGPSTKTIDYWTISVLGNASDFGDLLALTMAPATCSNDTNNRGIFMCGGAPSNYYTNTIQYITINTTGNATDFGDMVGVDPPGYPAISPTGQRGHAGGSSNGTAERGFMFGGYTYTGPGGTESWYKQIEYITISTPGNSSAFGSLVNMIYGPADCNNTFG